MRGDRLLKIVDEDWIGIGEFGRRAGQTALGRFIDDSDVAHAVRFLVSDGARNITGHDIVVDAGWDV